MRVTFHWILLPLKIALSFIIRYIIDSKINIVKLSYMWMKFINLCHIYKYTMKTFQLYWKCGWSNIITCSYTNSKLSENENASNSSKIKVNMYIKIKPQVLLESYKWFGCVMNILNIHLSYMGTYQLSPYKEIMYYLGGSLYHIRYKISMSWSIKQCYNFCFGDKYRHGNIHCYPSVKNKCWENSGKLSINQTFN